MYKEGINLEFENKQYDGPYEIAEINLESEGERFRGMIYLPPKSFKKPYPLVIYFHGFPQLFPLIDIIKNYRYVLENGFSFIIFNFRGYIYSQGKISIKNHVSDALTIIQLVKDMSAKNIFNLDNVNIVAHDFGAYIGLLLCSKIEIVNKLILISPILNLKRHVFNEDFKKNLEYINRFLPGNVRGTENVKEFVDLTKKELLEKQFSIENSIKELKNRKIKIIIGEVDKITPTKEVYQIFKDSNVIPKVSLINCMDHECVDEEDMKKIEEEIISFLKE